MPTAARRPALTAGTVAVVLAGLTLLLEPPSTDLAAQVYRAGLFDRVGFALWDNGWYGGHHLPAYSVLFPPLGGWLGVRVVGALSIVLAASAGTRALTAAIGPRAGASGAAVLGGAWLAASVAAMVTSGRLAFALGVAVGACAVLAVAHGRPGAAAALGLLTTAASPVAGLFVALACAGWAVAGRGRRRGAAIAAGGGAVVAGAMLALAFPEGGVEPFAGSSFWPALAATLILAAAAPRSARGVRVAAALYALLLAVSFAVANPLGGNAARLGALLAGPVAIALLWPRDRRRLLAVVVLPLAYWTADPAVRDWIQAGGDPSVRASYYAPLLAELKRRGGPLGRVEIPFTARHWEAAHVAASFPIARGWERQLDRRDNALFYGGALTPARYRRWLDALAVRWVALPDAALDPSARAEAALVRGGLPYLREAWRSPHWRLYAVRRPASLGALTLSAGGFVVRGARTVRVRFTPYWTITTGHGCVSRAPGGWTTVRPSPPQATVSVRARFALDRIAATDRRCRR